MRKDKIRQIIVISETDSKVFQEKMNNALVGIADPEITIFDVPFNAVITYKVSRDVPEDIVELFELLEGKSHFCQECPHFIPPTDKRKKWTTCPLTEEKTRADAIACENFYILRYRMLSEAAEAYKQIPYKPE